MADKTEVSQTIHIGTSDFERVKSFLKSGCWDNDNDARMLVQSDSVKICIAGFADMHPVDNEKSLNIARTIYFIKWKSGYYNIMPPEDLQYLYLIELFGCPSDYHYKSTSTKVDGVIKLGGMKKIVFVKDDNVKSQMSNITKNQ